MILAAINLGWMNTPTSRQVKEEFGEIVSQQIFSKYLDKNMFKAEEIKGMENCLKNK